VRVRLEQIRKVFGSVIANADVDLDLRPGEVVALLGENAAGKSTLMKVLYGFVRPDAGMIYVDEKPVQITSPRVARALGIGMVFQETSSIGALSVRENLALGAPSAPFWSSGRSRVVERSIEQLKQLAPELDPASLARDLSSGERQLLELAKVLGREPQLLILDEPTSLLTRPEAERLWAHVKLLAARGHSVVMITHKFEDVEQAADRVVVMRAGRIVYEGREVCDRATLVHAMLGADATTIGEASRTTLPLSAATRLQVQNLTAASGTARVDGVSFELAPGEILGIAGVTGNGQELLARVLAGVEAPRTGCVRLDGADLALSDAAIRDSIAYIPDQPRVQGCAQDLSVLANLFAFRVPTWRFLDRGASERGQAAELLERFDVRPRDLARPAGALSGGNLQKLVVARELSRTLRLIVACFPTLGLDVRATRQLIDELVSQARAGAALVWISEDLDPLLEHADRIAVMYRGQLRGPTPVASLTRARVGAWMTGVTEAAAEAVA
jgi:ABC-type uncharacterized transport system ATPase subunit